MFIAVLSSIARTWKQPKCLRIKKLWSLYTVDCYAGVRRNEAMKFAASWMELESIMLSAINQRVDKHRMSQLCGV